MDEEVYVLEKGSDEWKAACGAKNFGNDHSVKHGKYVKKPFICSTECKVSDTCPYAESCRGSECIVNIKETEAIENIIQRRIELLTKRINIAEVRLEITDALFNKKGFLTNADISDMENHLMALMDRLAKEKKND